MTNIFHTAKVTLADELHRFRNRHFLEAAMAASALLALADEEVLISERLALDYVLKNVGELKIFDVYKAVDMFRDHVEAIQRDNVAGRERVSKALARFSGLMVRNRVITLDRKSSPVFINFAFCFTN